jgi:predicted nucleic acid-binding Zn ribbon protein
MTARATTPGVEQTHACVRCGAPIPLADAMCERCNPLGLKQPASSQAHGTVFLGIAIAVILLAVLGKVVLSGVGPFDGVVSGVTASAAGLSVTLTVTNHGTRDGSTTCRVFDADDPGIGPSAAYLLSPQIPAGGTLSFSKQVTTLGSVVKALGTECTGP